MSEDTSWSIYQQAIFKNIEDGRGHTVVLARAGSGKTTTIMEGIKHVPARKSVWMAAFNKKIAEELSQRAPVGVEVSTLHSYGLRQCKAAFGNSVKIDSRKMDPLIMKKLGTFNGDAFQVKRSIGKVIGLAKAGLVGLVRDPSNDAQVGKAFEAIDNIIDAFQIDTGWDTAVVDMAEKLAKRNEYVHMVIDLMRQSSEQKDVLDFDDMIWFPVIHNMRLWQFDRVFVDETQDLNAAQIELAFRACKPGGRILAVGDDRQAIYAFRGADSQAIPGLIKRLDAKVMKLTVCYRCALSIVEKAAETVPDFEPSPSAIRGLVEVGVTEDTMKKKAAAGDFILSRSNAPLISLCWSFLRAGVPATIQGKDFASNLTGMITKARKATIMKPEGKVPVTSVEDFLDWLDDWRLVEGQRLRAKDMSTDAVDDKADCLIALTDGCRSLDEAVANAERLFGDVDDDRKRIVLSSTHKAKGLERDRVWVLADTYRKRPGIEEENLWYVALTRARAELYLVNGVGAPKGWAVARETDVPRDESSSLGPRVKRVKKGKVG